MSIAFWASVTVIFIVLVIVLVWLFVWRKDMKGEGRSEVLAEQAERKADEANQVADLRAERPMSPFGLQRWLRDRKDRDAG